MQFLQFLTYEYLVQQLLAKTGKTRAEMPAMYAVLFGASSGLAVSTVALAALLKLF